MTAHTPGPWKVVITDDGELIVLISEGNQAFLTTLYFGDMEVTTAEDHANARLTAAGPDLFKAGKTLAAEIYSTTNPGSIPQFVKDAMRVFGGEVGGTKRFCDRRILLGQHPDDISKTNRRLGVCQRLFGGHSCKRRPGLRGAR